SRSDYQEFRQLALNLLVGREVRGGTQPLGRVRTRAKPIALAPEIHPSSGRHFALQRQPTHQEVVYFRSLSPDQRMGSLVSASPQQGDHLYQDDSQALLAMA